MAMNRKLENDISITTFSGKITEDDVFKSILDLENRIKNKKEHYGIIINNDDVIFEFDITFSILFKKKFLSALKNTPHVYLAFVGNGENFSLIFETMCTMITRKGIHFKKFNTDIDAKAWIMEMKYREKKEQ